jgi:hypothetical protein
MHAAAACCCVLLLLLLQVAAAVSAQLFRVNTNSRYLSAELNTYIQELTDTLPHPLQVCRAQHGLCTRTMHGMRCSQEGSNGVFGWGAADPMHMYITLTTAKPTHWIIMPEMHAPWKHVWCMPVAAMHVASLIQSALCPHPQPSPHILLSPPPGCVPGQQWVRGKRPGTQDCSSKPCRPGWWQQQQQQCA